MLFFQKFQLFSNLKKNLQKYRINLFLCLDLLFIISVATVTKIQSHKLAFCVCVSEYCGELLTFVVNKCKMV